MFAEYEHPLHQGDPKSFTFGPLAQTEFGEIAGIGALHTLNLLFTKDGRKQSNRCDTAVHRLAIATAAQPAVSARVEYYGQVNEY